MWWWCTHLYRHGQVLDEGGEFEAADEHEGEPEGSRGEAQRNQHLQAPHVRRRRDNTRTGENLENTSAEKT